MDCKEAHSLLSAYADEESTGSHTAPAELAAHLAECTNCTLDLEALIAARAAVQTHAVRYTAPDALRRRIRHSLRPPKPSLGSRLREWPWAWINLGVAGACSLALALTFIGSAPPVDDNLTQEIVASHFRSLMVNHLADVASSDRHTVKPWFAGKLDYSPPVVDLAQQDFPLLGGRLDYVDQRPVAALAYRHRQHLLNLFIWPDKAGRDRAVRATSRQGYALLHWSRAGMNYWLISDMGSHELLDFQRLLAAQIDREYRP